MKNKPRNIDSILNESYFTGGAAMDPYLANNGGTSRDNYGYHYKTLFFNHSLENKNKGTNLDGTSFLMRGSKVSGLNRKGERIVGHIWKIDKDSNGFIQKVYILSNGKPTLVDIDSIHPEIRSISKNHLLYIKESFTPEKAVIMDYLIKYGHINFIFENKNYIATMNNGSALILELNKKHNITKISNLLECDNKLTSTIYKKIED